jgi:hypothetical protein
VRVVALSKYEINDNHHGVFVRTHREGLCYHRCGYHCGALHRENEDRRGQDQNSQSPPSNGLLWRVRFVHVPRTPPYPYSRKRTNKNLDFFISPLAPRRLNPCRRYHPVRRIHRAKHQTLPHPQLLPTASTVRCSVDTSLVGRIAALTLALLRQPPPRRI